MNIAIKAKIYFYSLLISLLSIGIFYLLFFFGKSIYWALFFIFIVFLGLTQLPFLKKIVLIMILWFIIAIPVSFWIIDYRFANYVSLTPLLYTILFAFLVFFEKKLEFKTKYFKFIIIFLILVFLAGSSLTNYEETVEVINRISDPEGYYAEFSYALYNREIYPNNVVVQIDYPQGNEIIKGIIIIKGWTADLSEIPDAQVNKIYAFMDGKPYEGGKFLGEIDSRTRRMDVAEAYGDRHKDSGFYFELFSNRYSNGWHTIYVYTHSNYFGWNYNKVKLYFDN